MESKLKNYIPSEIVRLQTSVESLKKQMKFQQEFLDHISEISTMEQDSETIILHSKESGTWFSHKHIVDVSLHGTQFSKPLCITLGSGDTIKKLLQESESDLQKRSNKNIQLNSSADPSGTQILISAGHKDPFVVILDVSSSYKLSKPPQIFSGKLRRRLAETEQQLNDEEKNLRELESLPDILNSKIKELEIDKNNATTAFTARSTKLDGEIRQKEVEHAELTNEKNSLEVKMKELRESPAVSLLTDMSHRLQRGDLENTWSAKLKLLK